MRYLAAIGCLLLGAAASSAEDARDVLCWGDEAPIFLRVHIRIDQASYRKPWDDNAKEMFGEMDLDDDGGLNPEEAKRLPAPGQSGAIHRTSWWAKNWRSELSPAP